MAVEKTIQQLESFKQDVLSYQQVAGFGGLSEAKERTLRSKINQQVQWVRKTVMDAGCHGTLTICPPPAVGGPITNNVDPFQRMFNPPWGADLASIAVDMIDHTIGCLRTGLVPVDKEEPSPQIQSEHTKDYAFVAMPMTKGDGALIDVLDSIKEAAKRCGVMAERVDDPQTNDPITARILDSIAKAEFVIADLTNSRPNVYYEAGYAQALKKTPIYIAREGTKVEFDLRDFPVIFFDSMRQLKDELEKRLRGLIAMRDAR
jgi:hypothetical protein